MNKYRNVRVYIDGRRFDSKKEAARYRVLKRLEAAGKIQDLKLQPKYKICPKVGNYRARHYIADFQYREGDDIIVEDAKSPATIKDSTYTLKRQLFIAHYPCFIFRET